MQTIGLILAGGQSQRMGRDKALITYQGHTFLDHAIHLLKAFNVNQLGVLGRRDHPLGIPDPAPGAGPATNLHAWINHQPAPFKLIVIPVDMPLLALEHLSALDAGNGGYFDDLYLPFIATISGHIEGRSVRMKDLLTSLALTAKAVPKAWEQQLTNFNSETDLKDLR